MHSLLLLLAPPVAGVALGYLLGGRLQGVWTIRVKALWLLWLAALVQAAQYYVPFLRHVLEERLGVPMVAIVFAIVLTWLGINLGQWPVAIRAAGFVIAVGALLNGLAIGLNGRMPYEPAAAQAVGLQPGLTTPKNQPADPDTRLAWLGDTVPVAPLHKVVSPGDLLISAGTAALIALAMRRDRRNQPEPVPQPTTGGN